MSNDSLKIDCNVVSGILNGVVVAVLLKTLIFGSCFDRSSSIQKVGHHLRGGLDRCFATLHPFIRLLYTLWNFYHRAHWRFGWNLMLKTLFKMHFDKCLFASSWIWECHCFELLCLSFTNWSFREETLDSFALICYQVYSWARNCVANFDHSMSLYFDNWSWQTDFQKSLVL